MSEDKQGPNKQKDLGEENARLREELAAARAPVMVADPKPPTSAVVAEDIVDSKVRALHSKAKSQAGRYADSKTGRVPLAEAAQDRLIALRDLNVAYFGHGVALYSGGDLYIGPQGVHPRNAAKVLAAVVQVGDLAELVDELHDKLEYEAA